MENIMRKILIMIALTMLSSVSEAGSWSDWAVPTRIDVERGNGVMIWGTFGNNGNCSFSNRVYVPETHPQYDKVYALVLSAFTANKEVLFYIDDCQPVTWYAVKEKTFNWATRNGVNIRQP
jgi:hypothetical protein